MTRFQRFCSLPIDPLARSLPPTSCVAETQVLGYPHNLPPKRLCHPILWHGSGYCSSGYKFSSPRSTASLVRIGSFRASQVKAMARIAVIVGCGSKHDRGGTAAEFAPAVRFGLGGALAIGFAKSSSFDHVLLLSRCAMCLHMCARTRVRLMPSACSQAPGAARPGESGSRGSGRTWRGHDHGLRRHVRH